MTILIGTFCKPKFGNLDGNGPRPGERCEKNGAFSRKSIQTFGWRALAMEPNKIFGSVQAGRFESAHVAMCFGSLGLQDATSTSALFVSSSVMSLFSRSSSSTASIPSSPVCSPARNSRLLRNHRSLPRTVP